METFNALPPAQLWIGNPEHLAHEVKKYVQHYLCTHKGCSQCPACRNIQERQHASLLWLAPEKNYTLEQLEPLKHTISFALDSDHHYFIVLEGADALPPACANSLLKILEEPPRGYHFILLAHVRDAVLPTIQSRCFIMNKHTHAHERASHDIVYALTLHPPRCAFEFLQIVEKSPPDENMSQIMLEEILSFWLEKYKIHSENDSITEKKIVTMIESVHKALAQPPMPGSSKLFWKNIYLQLTTCY
jgi:hypothetical protein